MEKPYEYAPLQSTNEIRVLDILQSSSNSRIECHIRHIDCTEAPYVALSYVWGDPAQEQKAHILDAEGVECGVVPLTRNLTNALNSLRTVRSDSTSTFWIDQICIDQHNVEEKSCQVAMMDVIYRSAGEVITFVGPTGSTEEARSGMRLLDQLDILFPPEHEIFEIMSQATSSLVAHSELKPRADLFEHLPQDMRASEGSDSETELARFIGEGWKWLFETAFGDWTQRLWIVQEQTLNPRTSLLQGLNLVAWDKLVRIALLWSFRVVPTPDFWICFLRMRAGRHRGTRDINLEVLHAIWKNRKIRYDVTKPTILRTPLLLTNMATFQYLQCRDGRDRVYALLGISRDAIRLRLVPDYSASNTSFKLSIQIASMFHQDEEVGTSGLFTLACKWHHSSELPSWSLNVDILDSALIPWNLGHDIWYPHPTKPLPERLKTLPSIHMRNLTLSCKGRVLDTITCSTSRVFWPLTYQCYSIIDEATVRATSQHLLIVCEVLRPKVGLEQVAMLCRAVSCCADWLPPHHETLSKMEHATFHFLWWFYDSFVWLSFMAKEHDVDVNSVLHVCACLVLDICKLLPPPFSRVQVTWNLKDDDPESFTQYCMKSNVMREGRSLAVTEAGRFCNIMHQAEIGDKVVVFDGADTLHIARPVGDKFRLIGDAYVDGLMKGEAYEGLDPADVDYDIVLV